MTEHRRRLFRRWRCVCGRSWTCDVYLLRRDEATRPSRPGGGASAVPRPAGRIDTDTHLAGSATRTARQDRGSDGVTDSVTRIDRAAPRFGTVPAGATRSTGVTGRMTVTAGSSTSTARARRGSARAAGGASGTAGRASGTASTASRASGAAGPSWTDLRRGWT